MALVVVCLAMLMNSLDQTIVNVALPTIQRELHFGQAELAWVIDAYLITFGGALLLAGRLGDLVGRKKVFIAGVTLFTLASAACGAANTRELLIGARFVQGLGAALSSSVILAIIVAEFRNPLERAKAMSAYVFVAVGGGAVGLLVGGILTQTLSWHWIFFINLPIGIGTLLLGGRLIDENQGLGIRRGLDVTGAVLSTAGLSLAIYAIVTWGQGPWYAVHTLVSGIGAVLLLGSFAWWERRSPIPLMPFRILRARGMNAANAVRALTVVGIFSVFFIGSLYLQRVLGYDTLRTGLAFLPMTMVILALSTGLTARVMHRIGPKPTATAGLAVALAGLVLFSQGDAHTSYVPLILLAFLLVGLGMGTLFTPLITIAVADVPKEDAGLASGVVNVVQQMAAALGVAILGSVSASRIKTLLTNGQPLHSAELSGYHLAFVIASIAVTSALLLTVVLLRNPVHRDEEVPGSEDGRGGAVGMTASEGREVEAPAGLI